MVGKYKEGKINNVTGFTQFLHDPLTGPGPGWANERRLRVMGE